MSGARTAPLAPPRRGAAGFTLAELLVALALLSVIAVLGYAGVQQLSVAETRSARLLDRLAAAQRLCAELEHAVTQALPRPIRVGPAGVRAAVVGRSTQRGAILELTYLDQGIQRVAFVREGDRIERRTWPRLDRDASVQPETRVILEGVEAARFRFVDQHGGWHDQWPRAGDPADALPSGVEATVVIAGWGGLRRLWRLPAAAYWAQPSRALRQPAGDGG